MKTSSSQFDLMVTFMEQHGDLNKPSSSARGRLFGLQKWEELAQLLNSDGSGDTKTCEKWRKVWSDYKNNIKKKSARLHRAASGTGGGPANIAKLSDLEQRVLNLIGMHVATGLAVDEAGLAQRIQPESNSYIITASPLLPSPGRAISSPPLAFTEELIESCELGNGAGPSRQTCVTTETSQSPQRHQVSPLIIAGAQVENTLTTTPAPPQIHISPPAPALSGNTTPRRTRPVRIRRSPRRQIRPAHSDMAAQQFLQAEANWREFKSLQHKDYMEMRRQQNKIREMDVEVQREWQKVVSKGLDVLEKLVDKFCRD